MTPSGIEPENLRSVWTNCATSCGHLKTFNTHNEKIHNLRKCLYLATCIDAGTPLEISVKSRSFCWWSPSSLFLQYNTVKFKCSCCRPGCRVGRGIALLFSDRGTRRGWVWSATHPGRTLPPGKTRYPLYRRLGGPQFRSGRAEKLAPPGFDPRTVQPVTQSLYRLSFPAHIIIQ